MHSPLSIHKLSLSFPTKICFQEFSTNVYFGSRIAIIGSNGSGKSSLLKLLLGQLDYCEGNIDCPENVMFGYVPQTSDNTSHLSGGEQFNYLLTQALSLSPNCLLLDEPTNHLDQANRESLLKLLDSYYGTLIIASHDQQLLNYSFDTIWHINNEKITIFNGSYVAYLREVVIKETVLTQKLASLERQKKETHNKLMKEQERAKKRKIYGENKYDGDKLALRSAQGRGQLTANKNRKHIADEKTAIFEQLSELKRPEIIKPKFNLTTQSHNRVVTHIRDGSVGYQETILEIPHFTLQGKERIAITGLNGSGKTTFLKAILNTNLRQTGDWQTPKSADIGYLDQKYATLCAEHTVYETIEALALNWHPQDIRNHLNRFLFRKNEVINLRISQLSGGEKARLCLAQIAAKIPKLLLLDEITNNLDIETKNHIVQVLQDFPGPMIVISHDEDFLQQITINQYYHVEKKILLSL